MIDIVSIYFHTKNQVGGFCVGGVSIQPGDLPRTQKNDKQVDFLKCVCLYKSTWRFMSIIEYIIYSSSSEERRVDYLKEAGCRL